MHARCAHGDQRSTLGPSDATSSCLKTASLAVLELVRYARLGPVSPRGRLSASMVLGLQAQITIVGFFCGCWGSVWVLVFA